MKAVRFSCWNPGQAVLSSTVIAAPWFQANMTQGLHGFCKNGAISDARMYTKHRRAAHSRNRTFVDK